MGKTIKRVFKGKDDPDKISLEGVFPRGDLIFSTPFDAEQGKHHRVVVEGSSVLLERFDDYASALLESEPDAFGRWVALTDYVLEEPSLELIYEPRKTREKNMNLRLLVFVLRTDLVKVCNLRLSPFSVISATRGYITVLYKQISLPENIGNGFLDFAPSVVLSSPKKVN